MADYLQIKLIIYLYLLQQQKNKKLKNANTKKLHKHTKY